MKYSIYTLALGLIFSCSKQSPSPVELPTGNSNQMTVAAVTTLNENFETGTKASYAAADVALSSGTWNLNDALIGNTASDPKSGLQSARVRNNGKLTMKFDKPNGAGTVSVSHAKYGTDANGTWQLWYSTNSGTSYLQSGTSVTTSTTTLQTSTFTINVTGNVRIEVRKTDAGTNRINFDDVVVNDYVGNNPIPTLSGISPTSCTAGAPAFTLTVTGTNFINGSIVNWNGSSLSTTFVSATQVQASVSASLVAATGSGSVTVFTPAPGGGTTSSASFTINPVAQTGAKKFLFDASQGQTAGNADWVIDEDNSTPQRIPTPLQSTVTATTAATYWTGAISSWGIALVKLGHTVETLPSSGSITYGNTGNAQDLANYDVFVVDEPNIRFTAAEKTAMLQFVQNGGGLLMVSDHNVSDRNNDGWDSPAIWNDFFTNNGTITNPFGMAIDLNNISLTSSNLSSVSHPILNGSNGIVTQLQFNNGASLTLNPTANSTIQGLIWRTGYAQSSTGCMSAASSYGTGRVFMLGDSSPVDDGTGAPGNTLYNGWGVYSHAALLLNASKWVAKLP